MSNLERCVQLHALFLRGSELLSGAGNLAHVLFCLRLQAPNFFRRQLRFECELSFAPLQILRVLLDVRMIHRVLSGNLRG